MHRHYRIGSEDQLGLRSREADKGEARQDGGECKPAHDLDGCDHMTVHAGRIHLAIADRSECFDAEKEDVQEAARPRIRDRTGCQPEQGGEDDVQGQIKGEQRRDELGPSQANGQMVGITQIETRDPLQLELDGAEAKPRRTIDWDAGAPSVWHCRAIPF